jgi:hypothetical protein
VLAQENGCEQLRFRHAPELTQRRDASGTPLGDELAIAGHMLIELLQGAGTVASLERGLNVGEQRDFFA